MISALRVALVSATSEGVTPEIVGAEAATKDRSSPKEVPRPFEATRRKW